MRNADLAMYQAKETGKGRFEIFDPEGRRDADRRQHEGGAAPRRRAGELEVHYQPIVELRHGRPRPRRRSCAGTTPSAAFLPSEFIPLAEETGLIVPIGRFVLDESCRQAAQWQAPRRRAGRRARQPLRALELADPAWRRRRGDACGGRPRPDPLVLEITESRAARGRRDSVRRCTRCASSACASRSTTSARATRR